MSGTPLSRNESIKGDSNFLRGTIAEGLADRISGAISEDDTQLTKFHGIYQQDDRDLRAERAKKKMEKAFIFMARLRVPGGVLSARQWIAMHDMAAERGNGTLRLTTRQTIQFHGIIKSNLKPAIQAINRAMLDTIAACGDVNRNVICTPNPYRSAVHAEALAMARALSVHLLPRSRAWHEIFIDGEQVAGGEEEEPILGRAYLPRKFKIAIAVPPLNDVDAFAHEIGLIAIVEHGAIVGYNVAIGGGMGMTHGEPDTFPRTGDLIGFCRPDQVVAFCEQVVTVQRDWGDRSDRKHARMKYTIERHGLEAFQTEVERRACFALAPARACTLDRSGDPSGWIEGDDGAFHYCLFVENGRVHGSILAGLRAIAEEYDGPFLITPNQNLVIANIAPFRKPRIDELLAEYGLSVEVTALRRNAMACVALPTCGLALAESERYLPELITALDAEIEQAGLRGEEITIRMTGCPNGCARPYLSEIGFVGTGPGSYNLYLGGAFNGARLSKLYRKQIGHDEIIATLRPLFAAYAREREAGEHFADYVIRAGVIAPTTAGNRFHADLAPGLSP